MNEAEDFQKKFPEETKRRLGVLVDKFDKDKDGNVTVEELTSWIDLIHKDHIRRDVEREWKIRNPDQVQNLPWPQYKKNVYGVLSVGKTKNMDSQSINEMIKGEQRRWGFADMDKDGALNVVEFQAFLHPESDERMGDVVLMEIIEDMDSDLDGSVNLEEYLADIVTDEDEENIIEHERNNFSDNLDLDKNGVLDKEEVRKWLIPVQYDYARGEAEFLVTVCDDDKNKVLSKTEIVNHYTKFTGSQATDYGKAITRHEEL